MNVHASDAIEEVFPVERRQQIVEVLRRSGKVVAADLARQHNVSIDTIRRDLNHLAQEGFVERVHGGAMLASPPIEPIVDRQGRDVELKQVVARKALALIQPGQIVIFDTGTTLIEMAQLVDPKLRFTAITRNLRAALILAERTEADVVILGGSIDRVDLAAGGIHLIREISNVRADLFFSGLCGVDAELGLTTRRIDEIELQRAFIQASGTVVGLGTREKIGTAGPFVIGPANLLDYLVVAPPLAEQEANAFRRRGIELL